VFVFVTDNALAISMVLGAASLVLLGASLYLLLRGRGRFAPPQRRRTYDESLSVSQR
jgi:hypothetical protein